MKEVAISELLLTDKRTIGDVDVRDEDLGVFGNVAESSEGGRRLGVGDYSVRTAGVVSLSKGRIEEETYRDVEGGGQGEGVDQDL